MDESNDSDSGPSAAGRQSSNPSGAVASASGAAAVATPPRRTTPQRATKANAAHARTSNRFFIEKLHGHQVPGRKYTRVMLYETNPHFDEETAKTCGPEDIGQCAAMVLLEERSWNVWRHEDGYFVTFNGTSESFSNGIYDIDSLEEGAEKFSSYEALGKWARGESGFFREKILHSTGMVQRFVEQMGLSEAEESGDSSARGKEVRKGKNFGKQRRKTMTALISSGRRGDASSDESENEDNRGGNYKTTGESDIEDEDEEEERRESSAAERPFFSPPNKEETELDRSQRSCVKAVSTFLRSEKEVRLETQCVSWDGILREISPEGAVVRSFASVAELNQLPLKTRDGLYVITCTRKTQANAHHAMALWKEKEQLGTSKMMLYDPGSEMGTRRVVDMCNRRIISSDWFGICAVFVPGTQVEKRDVEVIAISSSGEEEEEPAKKRSKRSGRGPGKSNEAPSASVSDGPIVSDGDLIDNLFDAIEEKYNSGVASEKEKQFYAHLRMYLAEKGYGLLVSEFNSIQTFMGRFESSMVKLKNASDDVGISMYTRRADRAARECAEELPALKVKSEEN